MDCKADGRRGSGLEEGGGADWLWKFCKEECGGLSRLSTCLCVGRKLRRLLHMFLEMDADLVTISPKTDFVSCVSSCNTDQGVWGHSKERVVKHSTAMKVKKSFFFALAYATSRRLGLCARELSSQNPIIGDLFLNWIKLHYVWWKS